MSDSLGQGFTASIVNSAANYVSSDRSTLGMVDGVTGAIQYVKLVWGGSGEAKFVSEAGTDPSALPVSLNNADNYWLINSVIDTVHRAPSGATAFRVAVDGSGLCFAGACFGNINIGAAISIAGFCAGATNANFGVTFGTVGITAPNGLRVRNFLSGAGVVEPLQVTGGVYGLGGTFAISNALSVDLSAGVTIMGVRAGFTMPVSIGAGGLSLGSDQIVTRINSIAPGITIGVALTTPGGTFFPGAYQGIPVFGVSGATALGVTFSGNVGVTFSGTVGVTFTGSFTTDLSAGVTIVGTRSGLVLGTTTSGPIQIVASSLLGITQNGLLGVTFGKIGFNTASAMGVSISDVGLSGNALLVAVVGAGLCLGTVTLTATQFGVYGLAGATAIAVTGRQGNTFGMVMVNPVGGLPLPGSDKGIPVFGVSGATAMGTTFGSVTIANSVKILNNLSADSIPVKIKDWQSLDNNINLIEHLKGLTVSISGFSAAMTIGATLGVFSGSTYLGVFLPSTGISISTMPNVILDSSSIAAVKGQADSLTNSPVGISMTGLLKGLSGFGTGGALIGITFPGVGICGPFNALNVAVVGAGLCLGTVTLTATQFGVYGISGGTAVNISQIAGSTLATVLTDRAGNVLGHSGAAFIGFPVHGVSGATALGVTFSGNVGTTFGGVTFSGNVGTTFGGVTFGGVTFSGNVGTTFGKVFVFGDATTNNAIGITWLGSQSIAGDVAIKNSTGSSLGVLILGGTASIRPYAYGNVLGSTLAVVLTNTIGFPLGMSGATLMGVPVFGVNGATALGVTFAGNVGTTFGGVTFGGVTFSTVKTVIVGSAFADGGNNLGVPVYGVVGATSVKVEVVGGTLTGIFLTEGAGITVLGVSSGIPVFGVSGATAIGVTFGGINTNILFPTTGITIAAISSGVTFGITGGVRIDNIPEVILNGDNNTVKISGDVGIIAGGLMNGFAKLLAATAAHGIIVTTKGGNQFMWGLTIGPWLGVSGGVSGIPLGSDIIGASGATDWFFRPTPIPATYLYNGPGIDGSTPAGITAVPLKQGLHIQLTKWDAISHVLIGYTAPSHFEFLKNAQVLHKEYQVAPIWGNAMDQFRRWPGGVTANSILASADPINDKGIDALGRPEYNFGGDAAHIEPKHHIGVIEKPSRIFVPTNDAGLVYILPKADYYNHAIGSGFWDQETGIWTSYTLYERSHFAGEMYGFSGGEPDLTDNGAPGSSAQYGETSTGTNILTTGAAYNFRQSEAIGKILASYGSGTPFIRMWGY